MRQRQCLNPTTRAFTKDEIEWIQTRPRSLAFQVHFRCAECGNIQPICMIQNGSWVCGRPECWNKWVASTEPIDT